MIDIEDFFYRFCSFPWTDLEDRPKLVSAIRLLCERIPADVYEALPTITILAPYGGKYGQVTPAPDGVMIYLSAQLEDLEQTESDFVLAHEFAHAFLGHWTREWWTQETDVSKEYLQQPSEIAADALCKRWGYEIPERRGRNA